MAKKRINAEVQERRARADRLNRTLKKSLKILKPPSGITVTEWAEKYRRLSAESSAEAGLFRVSRTPYLKEIMDCFTDTKIDHIVFVAASQVGKSEFINNCIGYIIDEDPGSILFVHPTDDDVEDYSERRIAPMIRDCPRLRRKVADPKSRDGKNTISKKAFPGGILSLCSSRTAHALASKPVRYLFGDERDRWARSAGTEGDPWGLARRRQTTFYNSMAIECSTPTIKGHSPIESSYGQGTMERYCSQCPHCGAYHDIRFKDIRFEYTEREIAGVKTFDVTDIWYCCPGCGAISTERDMKHAPARWVPEHPEAIKNGCRSFWLNAFVSPWMSWHKIITDFLGAREDPEKLQVVFNTEFGELWENRGDMESEENLLSRREDYGFDANGEPVEVPEGALVLTCGIDTQDNRLEYEVVGHGKNKETYGIRYGVIMGRPDAEETWEKLDEILDRTWHYADGQSVRISVAYMDEGGHYTQIVREQCAKRSAKQLYAIKGLAGKDTPFFSPPKRMGIIDADEKIKGYCWQYQIGVSSGKRQVMDNLKVQEPGKRGYCHFPDRDDYGPRYFRGLLSEREIYNEKKPKNPYEWVKLPGHERNEPLDIRVYNLCAFESLSCDMDALDKKLKQRRGILPPDPPQRPAQNPQTVQRHTQPIRRQNNDLTPDAW